MSTLHVQVGQVLLRELLLAAITLVHEAAIVRLNTSAYELFNLRKDLFYHYVQIFKYCNVLILQKRRSTSLIFYVRR